MNDSRQPGAFQIQGMTTFLAKVLNLTPLA